MQSVGKNHNVASETELVLVGKNDLTLRVYKFVVKTVK